MAEANFPMGPIQGSSNMRKFKAGEPVALRIPMLPGVISGTYVEPQASVVDNKIYSHVINFNHPAFGQVNMLVFSEHLGKIRQPVSATAANFVAQHTGLPANIGRVLSKYGGGSKKMGKSRFFTKRRTKEKLKSRRRSRRN